MARLTHMVTAGTITMGRPNMTQAFAIGVTLNTALVAAQIAIGLVAGSVALLADAVHNLGDVLGLLLAWGAVVLGRRAPSAARTYGWGREHHPGLARQRHAAADQHRRHRGGGDPAPGPSGAGRRPIGGVTGRGPACW